MPIKKRKPSSSSPPPAAAADQIQMEIEDEEEAAAVTAPTIKTRKAQPKPKPKTKPISKKMLAVIEHKLSLLSQNLRPFPLPPTPQTLIDSIASHEPLFLSLSLWDFAHLRLDSHLRTDLLSHLIAHYDPPNHRSLVLGLRIKLSRADLARALSLPLKNQKSTATATSGSNAEFDAEAFGGVDEVAAVLGGFISNKMVFLEDAAILPEEVVVANRLVREGQPNKVDWAGLMWALVEKEIKEAPERGSCYYASHIQCLMKCQKPRLFEESGGIELETEVEVSEAVTVDDEADVEEDGDVGSGKCGPELSLGIGGDGEECKKGDGSRNGEERKKGESLGIGGDGEESKKGEALGFGGDGEESKKGEEGEEEEKMLGGLECEDVKEGRDVGVVRKEVDGLSKGDENDGERVGDVLNNDELVVDRYPSLNRLASSDFMQVMGSNNDLQYGIDQSNGEFLAIGSDVMQNKSMVMDSGPEYSFLIENEQKRAIDEIDDHGNAFNQSHQQKRFRSDQPWEHTPTVAGFDRCSEHVQHLMAKARMDLVEKERNYMNAQVEIDYLNRVLQQKDEIIQSLEKASLEELRRRQTEACRFEHDLSTISSVLFGVKKALKDTQNTFVEYKRRFPLVNQIPSQHVSGIPSEVLGPEALREQCSQKKMEMRQIASRMIHDFQKSWFDKLHDHATWVSQSATKLVGLHQEFSLLKERFAKVQGQNHD